MKKILAILFLLLVLIFFYLIIVPSPIDSVAWTPSTNLGHTGEFEANEKLDALVFLDKELCVGCEDVAVDASGTYLYGGEKDGDILQINLETKKHQVIANTGGRPLGLHFDVKGNLIIADADKGLLALNIEQGNIETLVTHYKGEKMAFVDDLEIAKNGVIYFSDASDKHGISQVVEALMERKPNGTLYSYNPNTKETKRLLQELYFANGVALAADERFVLVNETGDYSVSKYWLKGPKAGTREKLLENLPGFPDGISKGENGIYWLTLIAPRKKTLDWVMDKPFLKNMVVKLPKALQPQASVYGCIVGINENGEVLHNYQSSNPEFLQIASVQQFGKRLYFGSLEDTGFAFMDLE